MIQPGPAHGGFPHSPVFARTHCRPSVACPRTMTRTRYRVPQKQVPPTPLNVLIVCMCSDTSLHGATGLNRLTGWVIEVQSIYTYVYRACSHGANR